VKEETGDVITDEHFNWRRTIAQEFKMDGDDESKLSQEYPETASEAFQSTGLCAFPKRRLSTILVTTVRRPILVGEIDLKDRDTPKLRLVEWSQKEKPPSTQEIGGRLRVWEEPEEGEKYYVSADCAQGLRGGDFSCAQVVKIGHGMRPDVQVAEWHGWINPTPYARVLAALGYWYNKAEIACELNDIGKLTGSELWRILEYDVLYQWKHTDKIRNFMTDYLGWVTNHKNREEIIAKMREAIEDETIILRSEDLIEEMFDFGNDGGGGRFEGQTGHDDRVFAIMINNYCCHEADFGMASQRKKKTDKIKKERKAPYAMTDFSPVHDRPGSQESRLHTEYDVPVEYTNLVGRAVSERIGLLPNPVQDEDVWRNL
jgi:hypothetical protein